MNPKLPEGWEVEPLPEDWEEEKAPSAPAPASQPSMATDALPAQPTERKIGEPTDKERRWGQIVSFLSGSPAFNTVAKASDALTGQRSIESARRATEQFSPKVAGVPMLPVAGSMVATAPAGAARIGGTLGGVALNTPRASALTRVALAGGIGGAEAADRGGDPLDVALGTGAGALGAGVGEGLSRVGQRFVKGAASRVGDVVQGRAAKDVADVAGDVAKLEGQYGAAAQALNRTNENLTRQVAGLPSSSGSLLPAQTQQKALGTLTDPDTIAALTEIAERDVTNLPGKTADYRRLQAASQAARAGAPQEAAKRTSDYFNESLWGSEIAPRLSALGQRGGVATLAGGVSGLLGAGGAMATGQDPLKVGMMTGAAGFGSVMGGQGLLTMGRNLAKSPRMQRAGLEAAVTGASAMGAPLRRMGATGASVVGTRVNESKSVADPLGPLRQYLGLSPEERRERDVEAFEASP